MIINLGPRKAVGCITFESICYYHTRDSNATCQGGDAAPLRCLLQQIALLDIPLKYNSSTCRAITGHRRDPQRATRTARRHLWHLQRAQFRASPHITIRRSTRGVRGKRPTAMAAETWTTLPPDLRLAVLAQLALSDAVALQQAQPRAYQRAQLAARVARLRPLWAAWVRAPRPPLVSHANNARWASIAARATCAPAEFSRLRRCALAGQRLRCLDGVGELRELEVLDVSFNELEALPDDLAACQKLKVLNCGRNSLDGFPRVLMKLPNLCTLFMHHNPLATLPAHWKGLPRLTRLGLYNCRLRGALPVEFCEHFCRPFSDEMVKVKEARSRRRPSANLLGNQFEGEDILEKMRSYPRLASRVAI